MFADEDRDLELNEETVEDLDVKDDAEDVKGGMPMNRPPGGHTTTGTSCAETAGSCGACC